MAAGPDWTAHQRAGCVAVLLPCRQAVFVKPERMGNKWQTAVNLGFEGLSAEAMARHPGGRRASAAMCALAHCKEAMLRSIACRKHAAASPSQQARCPWAKLVGSQAAKRRMCPFRGSASSAGCCQLAVGASLAWPVVIHRVYLDLLHDVFAPKQRAPVLEEKAYMFSTRRTSLSRLGVAVQHRFSFPPAATWP